MNTERILSIIKEKGYTAQYVEVQKGAITKAGIQMGEGQIRPVIYLSDLNDNSTDEAIADQIIKIYESNKQPDFDLNEIISAEYIKENAFISIRRPAEDNLFTKDFLDMQLVLRAKIDVPGDGAASYAIPKQLAEKLGLTDSIFDEAIKNMDFRVTTLAEAVAHVTGDEGLIPDLGMYVVSTEDRYHGAAVFYDIDFIDAMAEKLNGDLVIIPSSVHEVLIRRNDDDTNLTHISAMVKEINSLEVPLEEQLSDHAYLYIRETKTFKF